MSLSSLGQLAVLNLQRRAAQEKKPLLKPVQIQVANEPVQLIHDLMRLSLSSARGKTRPKEKTPLLKNAEEDLNLSFREVKQSSASSRRQAAAKNCKQETAAMNSKQETAAKNSQQETAAKNSKQEATAENANQETAAKNSKQETAAKNSKQEAITKNSNQKETRHRRQYSLAVKRGLAESCSSGWQWQEDEDSEDELRLELSLSEDELLG